eukprot:6196625-Pleurochrysis_carterae.AAC.3
MVPAHTESEQARLQMPRILARGGGAKGSMPGLLHPRNASEAACSKQRIRSIARQVTLEKHAW